jgi:hypothetical protein
MADEKSKPAHDETKDLDEVCLVEDLEPDAEGTEMVKGGAGDNPTGNISLNFGKVQY